MNEETVRSVTALLFLTGLAILVLLLLIGIVRMSIRESMGPRVQRRRLRNLVAAAAATEHRFEIPWERFELLSRHEVETILSRRGWRYAGDDIADRSWTLVFEVARPRE